MFLMTKHKMLDALIKLKQLVLSNKLFFLVIFAGLIWELTVFYRFPKEAWIDGLMQGWYMSQGLVIYKDTSSMYFPILYLLMIPFHQVFGFTQTPTLLLAPINSLLLFMLLSFTSWKWLKGWFRILPLVFFLIWEPYLGANRFSSTAFLNTMTFIVFILWWKWFERPQKITAFLMGLFLGVSMLTVQIVGLFVGVVVFSVFLKYWVERRYPDSLTSVLAGFFLPITFVLLWLISHNALSDFWTRAIAYYFAGSGYPYSMGRGLDNILVFIAVFSSLSLLFRNIQLQLSNSRKGNDSLRYVFLTLILLSFAIPFWFAVFHYSRFQSSLAICSFVFGFTIQQLLVSKKKNVIFNRFMIGIIVAVNVFGIYQVLIPKYRYNFNFPIEKTVLTKVYKDDPFLEVIRWVRKNTPDNAKILAMTDSLIYLETNRLPVNAHATSNLPVVYEPLDQFKQKIKNQPPDYWIIDERQWKRFNEFGYEKTAKLLQKILSCETEAAKIEYITIKKHEKGKPVCI